MTPSASFQHAPDNSASVKPLAKLTENLNESPTSASSPTRSTSAAGPYPSQNSATVDIEPEQDTTTSSPCKQQQQQQQPAATTTTTNSKAAIFKDLSKKLLKRVNSGNHNYYSNLKRNFRPKNRPEQQAPSDSTSSIGNLFDDQTPSAATATSARSRRKVSSTVTNSSFDKLQPNFRYPNSDNLSITGNFSPLSSTAHQAGHMASSKFDIKEFEKKLINLPTFTISDENSYAFLPNSISSTSIATIIQIPEGSNNINNKQDTLQQQCVQRQGSGNCAVRAVPEPGLASGAVVYSRDG